MLGSYLFVTEQFQGAEQVLGGGEGGRRLEQREKWGQTYLLLKEGVGRTGVVEEQIRPEVLEEVRQHVPHDPAPHTV